MIGWRGRSSKNPVNGVRVLVGVTSSFKFKKPLLAFIVPGAGLIVLGLAVSVYVIAVFLRWDKVAYNLMI